jgi:hypothetical protein
LATNPVNAKVQKIFQTSQKQIPAASGRIFNPRSSLLFSANSEIEFLQHSKSAHAARAGSDPVGALNPDPSPGP